MTDLQLRCNLFFLNVAVCLKSFGKIIFLFLKKSELLYSLYFFVVLIIVLLRTIYPAKEMSIMVDAQLQRQIDSITQQESVHNNNFNTDVSINDTSAPQVVSPTLFMFDPNTLDEQGFLKLGLNAKVVHTITSYRNKGGYFKSAKDFKKIYGLSNADAEKLIPYIQIASSKQINSAPEKSETAEQKTESSANTYQTININTATAEEWNALPGIGDALSNRIIKFRNSIGGFKSVDDLKRTYGLSDSAFNIIRPYLIIK